MRDIFCCGTLSMFLCNLSTQQHCKFIIGENIVDTVTCKNHIFILKIFFVVACCKNWISFTWSERVKWLTSGKQLTACSSWSFSLSLLNWKSPNALATARFPWIRPSLILYPHSLILLLSRGFDGLNTSVNPSTNPWLILTYDLRYWRRHPVPLYLLILEWFHLRILLESLKVFLAAAALSLFFETDRFSKATVIVSKNYPCLISSVLESPKLAVNIWIGVINVAVQVDPWLKILMVEQSDYQAKQPQYGNRSKLRQ